MIRILFLIPGLSEGGAEKVLRNLVNHMDQSQFEITVQTIDEYDPENFLAKGIRYKAINKCRTRWGRKLFSYWFRLCAEFKLAYRFFVKGDYDIEVAYLETIATKIIAQSTNHKAKKIAWVHCDLSKKKGVKEIVEKVKRQYHKYDRIVCVSEGARRSFETLFGRNFQMEVLPNVIDDEEVMAKSQESIQYIPEQGKIQMVALGRLTDEKNFSYLIDVCAQLRDTGYFFHLNILGEGPERENLERQITLLKLENIVSLRGFIQNPYPWLKQADMVVCSSKYEGLSTVVQEALLLHKPVVTTPCTGMTELLGQSEYGLIVDASDDGLYQGLYQMLSSSELRRKYTEKAQERAALLTKSAAVYATQAFFFNVLHEDSEEKGL